MPRVRLHQKRGREDRVLHRSWWWALVWDRGMLESGKGEIRILPKTRWREKVEDRGEGCTRGAEGHPGLCISHGGGRRCQHPNCGKGAQGSTIFASPTVEARGACLMAVPEVQRAARPCAKGTAAGRGASLREVVCAQGASMAELASALRMEMEAASAAPCPGAPRALVVALVAV